MAFDLLQKFIKTVKLEVSKKNNTDLTAIFEKTKNKKPILVSEIKILDRDKEIEVFNKTDMRLLKLTKNSKDILNMCNGISTVEQISQKIYQKKILKRKFLEDLILFLDKLEKEKFIVWK